MAFYPPASAFDYRELARKRLPKQLFDFIDGGAYNENTINNNNEDLQKILFRKQILNDVSILNTETTVLGQKLRQPLILAPIGFSGIYARRGEVQAAKAAAFSGVPFCLSTVSICSIEEVQKASPSPFWFQLYMIKDKGYCLELLQRAHAAGCPVLFLTADLPVVGVRYRDIRNGMAANSKFTLKARLSRLWQFLSSPLGMGCPYTRATTYIR